MKRNGRYAVVGAAAAILGLEVTAVHLFLDTGTAVRLWADAAIALAVGGCAALALLHRGDPAAGRGRPAEAVRQRRALRLRTDREARARACGRPYGRP
ncbi:hypothetical protein [Streptomyces sp. NPDC014894]|uniref:hypothetical protein n=1 Tax=unclassified Streptomyces TaxID=2593676 RepID=UPI0036F9CD53